MKQTYLWVLLVVAAVAFVGLLYFYQQYRPAVTPETAKKTTEEINETLGDLTPTKVQIVDPGEKISETQKEVNPLEKVNPFAKTYQNPFE